MIRWVGANWPSNGNVRALTTFRIGGLSAGGCSSLNLSSFTLDDPESVYGNREILRSELSLPNEPCWLNQQHTNKLLNLDEVEDLSLTEQIVADAAYTRKPRVVCAVLTADCIPILFKADSEHLVGVIHAGWRGILNGIIEEVVQKLPVDASELDVWFGPSISPRYFVVKNDVMHQFISKSPMYKSEFVTSFGKCHGNLVGIARQRLTSVGVKSVYVNRYCTYAFGDYFFSYRRDGERSGRMASLIWMLD